MISFTRLLCGGEHYGDTLRYSADSRGQVHGTRAGAGPVVVWNATRTCNLKCIHCYYSADTRKFAGELTTAEAKEFIDDLAQFHVPVLLISGGEPLARPDIFELARYAVDQGLRVTFSTNGTLITPDVAREMKELGVSYVGISLDGVESNNDRFRGKAGAFREALRGIQRCRAVGQRVGLRFTINRHNYQDLPEILRLLEEEDIPRACFYHLVYSGRGSAMVDQDVSRQESRQAVDLLRSQAREYGRRGMDKELLTVDNHADGVYLYLREQAEDPQRAAMILELLRRNGGNRSGIAIASVDSEGNIHADQFTQNHSFGNIREESFSRVWTRADDPILAGLKDRKPLLKGRCAACRFLDLCNGNFRARADAVAGDFRESDPACYLTDEEVRPA